MEKPFVLFFVIIGGTWHENHVQRGDQGDDDIDAFDALRLAEEAGSSKAVNLVLMGRLSRHFDFPEEEWMRTIENSVPAKFLEMNKKAFLLGRNSDN